MTSDVPIADNTNPAGALNTPLAKIVASAVVSVGMLLVSALIYSDQADLYDSTFAVALVRQMTAETVFQPIYLVVILVPIFIAAARNVSWLALIAGGLILLSVLLPYARFEYIDIASGDIDGAHNSLYQLAGPGHQMPQFASVLVLLLRARATPLFLLARVVCPLGVLRSIRPASRWAPGFY